MKVSVLLLTVLFASNIAVARVVNARGAAKRAHFWESNQYDIDDAIRAEEDPNFFQYLKERERQKKINEAALLENKRQRQAEEEAYERARVRFVKSTSKDTDPDDSKEEERYLKEQVAYEKQQEKHRIEYVIHQQRQEEKLKIERMARIQKVISPQLQRLPASKQLLGK